MTDIKAKEGKEFYEFVRETAATVSDWPECKTGASELIKIYDHEFSYEKHAEGCC